MMPDIIETERLIMRELIPGDEKGLFELDSDAEVHRFLGKKPIVHIEQAIEVIRLIRQQYIDNGLGRWAVIEKSNNEFAGWAGLKLMKEKTNNHVDYYDLGYRFKRKFWGRGIATEASRAWLDYGFERLKQEHIYAMTEAEHVASARVLQKCGLRYVETFIHDGSLHKWFSISEKEWELTLKKSNHENT